MTYEINSATLNMGVLLDILEGRGCVADEDMTEVWVFAHAVAHLTLGHLSELALTPGDEAAADSMAWSEWFSLSQSG